MLVKSLESKIESALKQIRAFGDMSDASYEEAAARVIQRVKQIHERRLKMPAYVPKRKPKPVAEREPEQSRYVESPFRQKVASLPDTKPKSASVPDINVKMKHLETGILVTCIAGEQTASFIVDRSKLR